MLSSKLFFGPNMPQVLVGWLARINRDGTPIETRIPIGDSILHIPLQTFFFFAK